MRTPTPREQVIDDLEQWPIVTFRQADISSENQLKGK